MKNDTSKIFMEVDKLAENFSNIDLNINFASVKGKLLLAFDEHDVDVDDRKVFLKYALGPTMEDDVYEGRLIQGLANIINDNEHNGYPYMCNHHDQDGTGECNTVDVFDQDEVWVKCDGLWPDWSSVDNEYPTDDEKDSNEQYYMGKRTHSDDEMDDSDTAPTKYRKIEDGCVPVKFNMSSKHPVHKFRPMYLPLKDGQNPEEREEAVYDSDWGSTDDESYDSSLAEGSEADWEDIPDENLEPEDFPEKYSKVQTYIDMYEEVIEYSDDDHSGLQTSGIKLSQKNMEALGMKKQRKPISKENILDERFIENSIKKGLTPDQIIDIVKKQIMNKINNDPYKLAKLKEFIAIRDIHREQYRTDLIIDVQHFSGLCDEIANDVTAYGKGFDYMKRDVDQDDTSFFTQEALKLLQTATEDYLIKMFEGSGLCAIHAQRTLIQPVDIQLDRREKGERA